MSDWDAYSERLSVAGDTTKDRLINQAKDQLIANIQDMPGSHSVTVNSLSVSMIVSQTDDANIKKIIASNENSLFCGDYVIWDGNYWVVTERDIDDEVYLRGKITRCNYELKWLNDNLDTVSRWCSITKPYLGGVIDGKIIDSPSANINIILPYDSYTVCLRRDKRFLIDFASTDISAYKIIDRDALTNVYNGHGIISLMLSQTTFNNAVDNTSLKIADYRVKPSGSIITGSTEIKLGQNSTYTTTNSSAVWTIVDNIGSLVSIVSQGETSIVLKATTDASKINNSFTLSDGINSVVITVKGIY